jgi:hypothetical protein
MQRLIENFAPDLRQGKSLSYLVLLNRIGQASEALSWKMEKAGFALEDPIRHVLLLQWKIEQPVRYQQINHYLATLNRDNALGPDSVRYQREYLYHSTQSVAAQDIPALLHQTIAQIIRDAEEKPDWLVQFTEEFLQDDELKAALGEHMTIVTHLLYTTLAQKMYDAYEQEEETSRRFRYLHDFFDYTVRDQEIQGLPARLQEIWLKLLDRESPAALFKLYEELGQMSRFQTALDPYFDSVQAAIQSRLSTEG